MPRYQTLGNNDKDAMLDFRQSEDKRNFYIYVTSTEYIISCYFSICSISFVAFVLMLYSHIVEQECLVLNEVVSNECDDVLDNVAPCMEQKCGE